MLWAAQLDMLYCTNPLFLNYFLVKPKPKAKTVCDKNQKQRISVTKAKNVCNKNQKKECLWQKTKAKIVCEWWIFVFGGLIAALSWFWWTWKVDMKNQNCSEMFQSIWCQIKRSLTGFVLFCLSEYCFSSCFKFSSNCPIRDDWRVNKLDST